MIDEVLPQLYRARIALPDSPLKYLNSYIIKASPRSLVIDTGLNREECLQEMTGALRELSIDLSQTDFFITHVHADHSGLIGTLPSETSKVYFNRIEPVELYEPDFWRERVNEFAVINGFPPAALKELFETHPASRYHLKTVPKLTILNDGDVLEAGDYSFRCIETPGHTAGHICLYAAKQKLLISGDHILTDITSNITARFDSNKDALSEYLQSLDKVYALDVALVLPGHRSLISDMRKRIRELKRHHEDRANEQLKILEKGDQNAYQVTTQMSWDMEYSEWDNLPSFQKYFAFAEGLAHLEYLKSLGKVREKKLSDGNIVYSLV